MKVTLQGRTALVTGASSGLGADIARQLAGRGANLVLVARRRERLEALAEDIESRYGVTCRVVAMDLGQPAAAAELGDLLEQEGRHIDILVNNAGFGLYGNFDEIDAQRERQMLELDMLTLTAMTRRFVPAMKARGWGRVMQVSSIGAFQPSPTYAAYAAAKSYVLMYGRAINQELRGSGVTCTVLAPGVTRTEFLDVAGQDATLYQRLVMMDSPQVAAAAVRAMLRGRGEIVPGVLNKLTAFSTRLMPRGCAAATAERLMR